MKIQFIIVTYLLASITVFNPLLLVYHTLNSKQKKALQKAGQEETGIQGTRGVPSHNPLFISSRILIALCVIIMTKD